MPTITVMDTEDVSLWFHLESKIVHHKIRRFLPPGVFQKVLTSGAEYLEKQKAKKWLSDDRDNTVVRQEDADWGTTVWAPRVIDAGFRYWAIVMPTKAIGRMQMRKFTEEYAARGVEVRVFENVEEAKAWLESVD